MNKSYSDIYDKSILRTVLLRELNKKDRGLGVDIKHPLHFILSNGKNRTDSLIDEVIMMMTLFPWVETYGLNFEQTISLEFNQWLKLKESLMKSSLNKDTKNLYTDRTEGLSKKLDTIIELLTNVLYTPEIKDTKNNVPVNNIFKNRDKNI